MPQGKKTGAKTHPRQVGPGEKSLGLRLRVMRMDRNLSQNDLADELGISFQQIQKYEKGINRISSVRLQQIAGIFGVSLQDMMGAENKNLTGELFDAETYKLVREFQDIPQHLKSRFRSLFRALNGGDDD